MFKDLKDSEFTIATSEGVCLIDFWAPWCGPCRMQGPIVEELAEELEGQVEVFKMNVDDEPQTASQFSIMSIPTMLVKKDGEVVEKLVGYHDKQRLVEVLSKYLNA